MLVARNERDMVALHLMWVLDAEMVLTTIIADGCGADDCLAILVVQNQSDMLTGEVVDHPQNGWRWIKRQAIGDLFYNLSRLEISEVFQHTTKLSLHHRPIGVLQVLKVDSMELVSVVVASFLWCISCPVNAVLDPAVILVLLVAGIEIASLDGQREGDAIVELLLGKTFI